MSPPPRIATRRPRVPARHGALAAADFVLLGQVVHREHHPVELEPGDVQVARPPGAGRDHDGVVLAAQAVPRGIDADADADTAAQLHALGRKDRQRRSITCFSSLNAPSRICSHARRTDRPGGRNTWPIAKRRPSARSSPSLPPLGAEEALGQLEQDPGAVAGLGIRAAGGPVRQPPQDLEAVVDDAAGAAAGDVGHEADPAGVVLGPGLI